MTATRTTATAPASKPAEPASARAAQTRNPDGPRIGTAARLRIALLVLLGFSLGTSEFIVIGIEPELARAFDVPLAQIGLLMSAFAITYAVATPLLALTTGRIRRHTLLLAYAALFCAGNIVAALAPTFAILLAARVLIGLVSGALLAVGVTYIPELVGMRHISLCISLVYAAFSVAMVVATSVGKILAATVGWHVALAGAVVLAVGTCGILVLAMPRSGAADVPATAREQLPLLREPLVISGALIFVFGVGSVYVFYGYVTPYLEEVLGMDTLGASSMLMAYGGMCFLSNLLSGFLDTHFGVKALRVTFPVQALLLLALFLVGGTMPAALAVILAIALTMYLVSTPCVSLFMTTATRTCPAALTLASSLEPTAFNVGIAFGTAVGGAVIEGAGLGFVGAVGAVFSLVAAALAALTTHFARRARIAV